MLTASLMIVGASLAQAVERPIRHRCVRRAVWKCLRGGTGPMLTASMHFDSQSQSCAPASRADAEGIYCSPSAV